MLTVSWRHKRRVPPRRGRGAILGLFFCFAQSNISGAGVSMAVPALTGRSGSLCSSLLLGHYPGLCLHKQNAPAHKGRGFLCRAFCPLREGHRVRFGSGGGVGDRPGGHNLRGHLATYKPLLDSGRNQIWRPLCQLQRVL
jgi:hypothetical protein